MEQFADKWMTVAQQVGGEAWKILVTQMYVVACTRMVVMVVLSLLCGISTVVTWIYVNKVGNLLESTRNTSGLSRYDIDERSGNLLIIAGISSCITVLCVMCLGFGLTDWLPTLLYPEGAALERLISAMGR